MKFKKILLTLGAVFAFALASCGGNNNSNTPSEGEGGQTPQADVSTPTYLTNSMLLKIIQQIKFCNHMLPNFGRD